MTNDSKTTDECYELAATLNEAVEVFYEPFDGHESTRIAAKILAAGYRKPRTITKVEEAAESVVTRHLSHLSKRDDWAEDDTAIGGQAAHIVRLLKEDGLLYEPEAEATR